MTHPTRRVATDAEREVEAALRGALIAKTALELAQSPVGGTKVRLVAQQIRQQLIDLERFIEKTYG